MLAELSLIRCLRFRRGPVYPEGPWRPELGVQRGSIQYMSICPGNPANREVACLGEAYANQSMIGTIIPNIPGIAWRQQDKRSVNIIVVQPISWGEALPLLSALGGVEAPAAWQGGIANLTYNIGNGSALVYLDLLMNYTTVTMYPLLAEFAYSF